MSIFLSLCAQFNQDIQLLSNINLMNAIETLVKYIQNKLTDYEISSLPEVS